MSPKEKLTAWPERLLAWFAQHQRPLPWRATRDPYRVWVSEVMLQQTQVTTVLPYYERFLAQFPDVATLAAAPEQAVLKAWEGLGYYARARRLRQAAIRVQATLGGRLPLTVAELRRLPGCGPYIAAAIASIAGGEPVPVVDGNVLRVGCRFWGLSDDIRRPATRTVLATRLQPWVATHDPGQFNQALMELGAVVCRPQQPQCADCPLSAECVARREHRVDELPVTSARPRRPHYDVAVGILWRGDRFVLRRRPGRGLLAGLWEFPGGKVQPGESHEAALLRRVLAETGLTVVPDGEYGVFRHAYTHFAITLHAYTCCLADRASPPADDLAPDCRWLTPAEAAACPCGKVARTIIQRLSACARP